MFYQNYTMKKHKGMTQKVSGDTLPQNFRQNLKETALKSGTPDTEILSECYNRLVNCEKLSLLSACLEQNHTVLKEDVSYKSYLQTLFQGTAIDKDVCKVFQSHVTKKSQSEETFMTEFEESILDYYKSSAHNTQMCFSILMQLSDSPVNTPYNSLLMKHTHVFLQPALQHLMKIPEVISQSSTDDETLKALVDNSNLVQQCMITSYNLKRAEEEANPVILIESDSLKSLRESLQSLDFSTVFSSGQTLNKELHITLLTILLYVTVLLCKKDQKSNVETSILTLLERDDYIMYRFIIMRSILSMKSPELNVYCQPYLSPTIDNIKQRQLEDPDVTYIMRTLCMWSQTWTRYDVTSHTVTHIQTEITTIYEYIGEYWDWYNNSIRELCEEIFSNIMMTCKREQLKEATSSYLSSILSNITRLSWTLKRKYRYLVIYIRTFGISDFLYVQYPGVIDQTELRCMVLRDVLDEITNQQLSNYVGNLTSMMVQHDRSFTSVEWVKLILDSITQKPHSHETFSKYIIPKLNKHMKDVNMLFLNHLTTSPHITANMRLVLMLAKQARSTGHLDEGGEGDKWCGIIEDDMMKSALKHKQCEVRMDAFAMLCNAHKTTTPILQKEFDWVSDFVNLNTFHEEPSFRQQIISNLKHFFYHILESGRKADENRTKLYMDFISELVKNQRSHLNLESLPARRTCALEILTLLTEILPDYFKQFLNGKKSS